MRLTGPALLCAFLSAAPSAATPPPVAISTEEKPAPDRASEPRSVARRFVQLESDASLQVLRPERAWGTPRAVELLREVAVAHRGRFPDAAPIVVGDLSREQGGRLSPHRSHRRGRDMDLRLPQRSGRELRLLAASRRTVDLERAWFLVEALVRTGEVEYIFLDRRIQRALRHFARDRASAEDLSEIFQYPRSARRWIGIVRHEPGHSSHLHVRFRRAPAAPDPSVSPIANRRAQGTRSSK